MPEADTMGLFWENNVNGSLNITAFETIWEDMR